jgi:23S rRNA (guanosine2251-2'-O)-methyltransferase
VLGNEGLGIRNSIKKYCDFLISIPVLGTISALNVSVSAGILLYEVLRQRKNLKMP